MPPLCHPQIINEFIWEIAAMITAKGKGRVLSKNEKTASVTLSTASARWTVLISNFGSPQ
jgi:hypothetical protein